MKPALLPTPTKAGVVAVTQGQPAPSQALPSSTTQPGQHNKAQADSSKKEKVTDLSLHQRSFSKVFFFSALFCLLSFGLSKFLLLLQKQQIQEKAINEVKTAIKPFYQKKEITKEEYKEIVRKAVEKVTPQISFTVICIFNAIRAQYTAFKLY